MKDQIYNIILKNSANFTKYDDLFVYCLENNIDEKELKKALTQLLKDNQIVKKYYDFLSNSLQSKKTTHSETIFLPNLQVKNINNLL